MRKNNNQYETPEPPKPDSFNGRGRKEKEKVEKSRTSPFLSFPGQSSFGLFVL
jgi:hypothetical protein